jgi:signal transduction histidine kinase
VVLCSDEFIRMNGGAPPPLETLRAFYLDGSPYSVEELPAYRALHGETVQRELLKLETRSRMISAEVSSVPLRRSDGSILAAVTTLIDVSEREETERQLMREALRREQALTIAAHDLGAPLAAVLAGLRMLLRERCIPPRVAARTFSLVALVERTQRLAAGILGAADAHLPLTLEPLDLTALVEQVASEFTLAWPTREISVEPKAPQTGQWDRLRITQVIQNLIENALKHGAPQAPVRLELMGDSTEVMLKVSNAGESIPPEMMLEIFKPFVRLERGAEQVMRRGLGLGLFIARKIVEAHGGGIEVRSEQTVTTFEVHLPRVPKRTAESPEHTATPTRLLC